jgi:integrase/recombinase XerD
VTSSAGLVGARVPVVWIAACRSDAIERPNADIARIIVIARTATPAPRRSGRSEPSPGLAISSLSHESPGPGIAGLAASYLQELEHAGRSAHTLRAYRTELRRLAAFHSDDIAQLGVEQLRAFLTTRIALSAASRARTQAALASFLAWAYRHGHIDADPMARIERVRVPPPAARGLRTADVERILQAIPRSQPRDRLLFCLIASTGLRAGEALALYIEDLDLTPDDEHLSVLGKGDRRRTVLLDDPQLVAMLRRYLKTTGYRHGPLFRAQKNGTGGPLSYQSAQRRWASYCAKTGITATLHQLRHTHATELVNDGVSLATIRKRLGHKNLQTTQRYAEQTDHAADQELRQWRRRKRSRN